MLLILALVILGHLVCDTTCFLVGRYTKVRWYVALPIMLTVSTMVALLIEGV